MAWCSGAVTHNHLHVGDARAAGGHAAQRHDRHEGGRHARARDQDQRTETHTVCGEGVEKALVGGTQGGTRSPASTSRRAAGQLTKFAPKFTFLTAERLYSS